jgi:site-specific DNA-cytosine methylase
MLMESPDILVGGFPCQDLSVAGHAKGIKEGTRSGLFFKMWEWALHFSPRFVLFENVPAIRTRGLDVVTDQITKKGWTLEWFCLSASSVGAWHKRERWWAIAHREEPLFDDYEEIGVNHLGYWFNLQQDLFSPQQVEMPKTGMARNGMLFQRSFSDHSSNRGWPTPTATDYKDGGSEHSIRQQVKRKGNGVRLGSYVPASENRLLPTPVRGDGHKLPSNSLSRYIESGGLRYSANDHRSTVDKIEWKPGKLNPDWVEPLMGLPSGFTDLSKEVSPEILPVSSWRDGSWEDGISRLTEKKTDRVSRIQSLGNSVVPQCVSAAFSILRGRLNE